MKSSSIAAIESTDFVKLVVNPKKVFLFNRKLCEAEANMTKNKQANDKSNFLTETFFKVGNKSTG